MLRNTPAMYKKAYPFLKEVDSLALANVQMHLEKAYKNFFRNPKIGFPKFKSKHRSRKSYTTNVVNGNIQVEDHRIKLPKLKWIRMKKHRDIAEKILPEICNNKCGTIRKVLCKSIIFDYEDFTRIDYAMHGMAVFSEDMGDSEKVLSHCVNRKNMLH